MATKSRAKTRSATKPDTVQSVELTIRLLERLAHSRNGLGLSDLARALKTTKTRALRHCRTLSQFSYVIQDPETDRYGCGPSLIALGQAVIDNLDMVEIARPVMNWLRETLGHSVTVSLVHGEILSVVDALPGKALLEIVVRPGAGIDLHSTAQGKIMLAYGPSHLLEVVLTSNQSRPSKTPFTLTSEKSLREEIARVREQGWAAAPQEFQIGLNSLAAPIFDHRGKLAGTVSILDLLQFIPKKPSKDQIAKIIQAGMRISSGLGHKDAVNG